MSEEIISTRLREEGWSFDPAEGFIATAGGLWHRGEGLSREYGFISSKLHENRNGVVHGGALITFADRALGSTARNAAPIEWGTTVTLNCNFMSPMKLGRFVSILPKVEKLTQKIVFMSGVMISNDEPVLSVQGVWKIRRETTYLAN